MLIYQVFIVRFMRIAKEILIAGKDQNSNVKPVTQARKRLVVLLY